MSYESLIRYANQRGMYVRLSYVTSRDGTRYKVTVQAGFLDGMGAKPGFRLVFPIAKPLMDAVNETCELPLEYFGTTARMSDGATRGR